jgi:hypothetical protein
MVIHFPFPSFNTMLTNLIGRFLLVPLSEPAASLHRNTITVVSKIDRPEIIKTILLSEAEQPTVLPGSLDPPGQSPGGSKGSVNVSLKPPKPPLSQPAQLQVVGSRRNKAAAPWAQSHSRDDRAICAEIKALEVEKEALKAERQADRELHRAVRWWHEGQASEGDHVLYERDHIEVEREIVYERDRLRERENEIDSRPRERDVMYVRERPREREIERVGEFFTIPVEREVIYEREGEAFYKRQRELELEFEDRLRTRPMAYTRERCVMCCRFFFFHVFIISYRHSPHTS